MDQGMIGLKVYNQVKINDPLFYPVIEKLTDLKMIILMHAHCGIGVGGKRKRIDNNYHQWPECGCHSPSYKGMD